MEEKNIGQYGPNGSDIGDVLENVVKKTDLASFQTFSRLCQVAQILKKRDFMLEVKWSKPVRVRARMVEFIPLPFFSSKLRIWTFHVVRSSAGTKKKFPKKLAWDQAQQLEGKDQLKTKIEKIPLGSLRSTIYYLLFFFLPTPIFFSFSPMRSLVPGYKKAWCTCRVVVLLVKTITAVLTVLLPWLPWL